MNYKQTRWTPYQKSQYRSDIDCNMYHHYDLLDYPQNAYVHWVPSKHELVESFIIHSFSRNQKILIKDKKIKKSDKTGNIQIIF
jgi:hypothetical protein